MANVSYDDRSFRIDGERVWLVSGSMDYFRVPAGLWRDRLLKAKRGGLNCVATRIAWDFHEPAEGRWEFSDDRDVMGFVRAAQELGLYVILRPGPYIGADWDFGGLPAWLTGKAGIAFRTSNAAFMHYLDKYLRQVLPRLAEFQVTRGGKIILIQNEQSYLSTTLPDRSQYLDFVSQLFRRSGFDIPIISANELTDPKAGDTIEAVAAGRDVVQKVKALRARQGGSPAVVVELSTGAADVWGVPGTAVSAKEVARRALAALGSGAQFNYHMWHGGTNFGFWPGRRSENDAAYVATSYDAGGPLSEGGLLGEKYYLTRLVNVMCTTMGRFLAGCSADLPAITVSDSTAVYNLGGVAGRWAIVTNNGRDEIDAVNLSVPGGRELRVSLAPLGAAAVPVGLVLAEGVRLDYANLMPLGLFGANVLVLHGPAGWDAQVSVNGAAVTATVPEGEEPKLIEHQGLVLVLVNSALAMRTWWTDEALLLGPTFVGLGDEEIHAAAKTQQYLQITPDGKLSRRKLPAGGAVGAAPAALELTDWKRVSVCVEPVDANLPWRKIDRPLDVDKLGVPQGYVWYRAAWDEPAAKKRKLLLPDLEDRAMVYVNGEYTGTWGRGEGASRQPMSAGVKKGRNSLVLLADNMGRFCDGSRLGELKGLCGPVYDAAPLALKKPKISSDEKFQRRIIPRNLLHMIPRLESLPQWAIDFEIPLKKVTPLQLSFADVPHDVAVLCNDRVLGVFPSGGANFGDLTINVGLKQGKNLLRVLVWGDMQPAEAAKFDLCALQEQVTAEAEWSWRPWEMPREGGPVVGKDQPAWYLAEFARPAGNRPMFLHIVAAKKGQIFLNGRNAGRFWTVGPQQSYYLPECWLADNNQLLLFVEQGDLPRRTRLEQAAAPKAP